MKWLLLIATIIAITIPSAWAAAVCSPAVLAARVGTSATLPGTITINNALPHFAPLTCSQATFYPQNGEGTYVVGFNVTDPCSGANTGGTKTITVTCANRMPANNVTVEWVFAPLSSANQVTLIGTISSCYNYAQGYWNVISAPIGSGYTAGQSLTTSSTDLTHYTTVFSATIAAPGPYALVFQAYDNCALYRRNVTVYWDGALLHVLPPTESTSTTCDGPLAPVKIAASPIKAAIWAGRVNSFGVTNIKTTLTVRASAGDEAVSFQWGLNTTDSGSNKVVASTLNTLSSVYVLGNISTAATYKVVNYTISVDTSVAAPIISTGASPLAGVHKPFAGSPAQGVYQGSISRLGYLSRQMTTTTTLNQSFIVTSIVTPANIVVNQICTITLTWSATSTTGMQISAVATMPSTTTPDATHWDYLNQGSKCAGTYMINVKTLDAAKCSSSDYDWFMIDCGPSPQPVLSPCNDATISFRYSDRAFQWMGSTKILDSTLSTDPYTTVTRTPVCCYQVNTAPASSSLSGSIYCGYCDWASFTPFTNFAPSFDVAGSYAISLYASNYCTSSKVTHNYNVVCDSYTITSGINPSGTTMSYDGTTFTAGVSVTLTSTTTSTVTDVAVGGYITQVWSFDSQPVLKAWVATRLGHDAGVFTAPTSVATSLTGYLAGTYVARLTSTIGCGITSAATTTITESCAATMTATGGTDQTTTDTCGTGWTTAITLTSVVTHSSGTYTALQYQWTLQSGPAASAYTAATLSTYFATTGASLVFLPDVAGIYVFTVDVYDYCQVVTSSTGTITAVQTPDPIATISITSTPSNPIYGKDLVSLVSTSDVTWAYLWNITAWPNGVAPNAASATITNLNTNTATFYAIPGGVYEVSVTITTTCGAKKTQSISLNIMCRYPLTALATATVSGSGNTSSTSVVTWPESNIWRQVTLIGTGSTYGSRWITNVTADWVVTSAPLDSIWAPVVNTTYSYNTIDNVINSTWTRRSIRSYTTVTKTWSHISPSSLSPLEACFQPDMPGVYTIEMRLTDGCQASVAIVTVQAACSSPPVAIITRRGSLPPTFGSTSQVAASTDTSLQSTTPPSDGTRMFLDASSSYSSQKGATLSYYWTWLSPSSIAGSSTGIDPQYGPKILLSPPYPSNSTLILYVSDGCTISTARLLVSCGSDVSPSLSSLAVSASVDPYSRTIPEFVLSTSTCYPQEATKWHLVSYTPTVRDFTMEAQATKINGVSSRYQSVGAMMIASVAVVIAMIFNW